MDYISFITKPPKPTCLRVLNKNLFFFLIKMMEIFETLLLGHHLRRQPTILQWKILHQCIMIQSIHWISPMIPTAEIWLIASEFSMLIMITFTTTSPLEFIIIQLLYRMETRFIPKLTHIRPVSHWLIILQRLISQSLEQILLYSINLSIMSIALIWGLLKEYSY